MGAVIESLHALQSIESDLQELRGVIARKARQAEMQVRRVEALTNDLAAKRAELKKRQAEVAERDLESSVYEEEATKLRAALNKAKTNKEYSAILTQINTAKANRDKIETESLNVIGEIEQCEKDIAALAEKQKTETAKLDAFREAHQAYEAETADTMATLERQREEATEAVPPQALATFERVAEGYEGEAMAQVVQLHPKRLEFSCSGCHMGVRLEQVNALKSRDEIQLCNVCGRILYLEAPVTRAVS